MFKRNSIASSPQLAWLPLGIAVTMLSGVGFATTQTILRSGADDPQIQITEDIARALASGKAAKSLVPAEQVDIGNSLATFITIYDDELKPLESSGNYDAQILVPDKGVFDTAKNNSQHRLTWSPKTNVRIATVIRRFEGNQSGYVLAGRSLREAEKRTQQVQNYWLVSWFLTLLLTFLTHGYINRKKNSVQHATIHM